MLECLYVYVQLVQIFIIWLPLGKYANMWLYGNYVIIASPQYLTICIIMCIVSLNKEKKTQ